MTVQAAPPGGWRPGWPPELTAEQEAMLARIRDRWAAVGLDAGPTDRQAAEAGFRQAYRAAGLAPAQRVLWLASPLQGVVAAAILDGHDRDPEGIAWLRRLLRQLASDGRTTVPAALGRPAAAGVGRPVRSWVGPLLWARLRAEVQGQLGHGRWALLWTRTGQPLSRRLLGWRTVAPLVRVLRDRLAPTIQQWQLDAVVAQAASGPLDAVWCGVAAAARQLFPEARGPERLAGLERATAAAGWWWPFERAVVACERPVGVHRDQSGRPHNPDGPALAWPDGFAVHAWHGMPVPAGLVDRLAEVRLDDVRAEPNVELRRVLLERYGLDRYLREVGATRLHQDAAGTLWQAPLRDDEPLVMVEVVNATPEPDGTRRVYWLRVPPATRTAREGVAWTFGLSEDQYRPQRES